MLFRSGDELWVSGSLGDAGWALYCMIGDIQVEASASQIAKYECPEARVALGIGLRRIATSCIDISDGLLSEAAHLGNASAVTINIYFAAVPTNLSEPLASSEYAARARHCLLSTGDAYELLFTAPVTQHAAVAELLRAQGLAGACIGRVTASDSAAKVRVLDAQSRPMNIEIKGWDHFA